MGQNDMVERLVGDRADAIDHLARQTRSGLRLDHHDAVIADDHTGIGIALGGEGVKPLADPGKAGLFLRQVTLRCACLGDHLFLA